MFKESQITFLGENVADEEITKVSAFISYANNAIKDYFGTVSSFDILICQGRWEMEVQTLSRGLLQSNLPFSNNNDISGTVFIGLTDYRLEEIIIRSDVARFEHYLHELVHGVISKDLRHQLREGLAWYFTLRLTEKHSYLRPRYPSWVSKIYVQPTTHLAEIVGDDFLKDLALGNASVEYISFPADVKALFDPEELFYPKVGRYL